MSDIYEKFAAETYQRIHHDMEQALVQSGDLPILVVSGEHHQDTNVEQFLDRFTPASFEEPAAAAAYAHISAIRAAIDLVGIRNVIVSIEDDKIGLGLLSSFSTLVKSEEQTLPTVRAFMYARSNNLQIVANDPDHNLGTYSEVRDESEIESLQLTANRHPSPPKIVVHLGGAGHFGSLQGYTYQDIADRGDSLSRNPDMDPFEGIYGATLFYNSAQHSPIDYTYRNLIGTGRAVNYFENPDNAVQIDPPGKMDNEDVILIEQRIEQASSELNANTTEDSVQIGNARDINLNIDNKNPAITR